MTTETGSKNTINIQPDISEIKCNEAMKFG